MASLNVVTDPTQTLAVPVIADGAALTVTVVVEVQPVASLYVIIDVPASTPATAPLREPMVALAAMLLVQVPPPALLKVVVAPVHTVVGPLMAPGNGLTVIVLVAVQPPLTV